MCNACQEGLRLLGVQAGSTPYQVKQAYRDMTFFLHPDRCGSNLRRRTAAEERLKSVNVAYEHLCVHYREGSAEPAITVSEPFVEWSSVEVRVSPNQKETPTGTEEAQEAANAYDPGGRATIYSASKSQTPLAVRWARVFFASVWRLAKLVVLIAFSLLAAFIVLLGVLAALSDYWKNEAEIHSNPFHRSMGQRFFGSVMEWSGLPAIAAKGLLFLTSGVILAGAFVFAYMRPLLVEHTIMLGVTGSVLGLLTCFWIGSQEAHLEFDNGGAQHRGAPAWILGIIVTAFSIVVPIKMLSHQMPSSQAAPPNESVKTSSSPASVIAASQKKPAIMVRKALLWDFRTRVPESSVPADIKEGILDVVAPITGHRDNLIIQGPISGRFLSASEEPISLYAVSLNWLIADRSHAQGDRVFAVLLGKSGPKAFELERGGIAVKALTISSDLPDLLVAISSWSGQGEVQELLRIYTFDDEKAVIKAESEVGYDWYCADQTPKGSVASLVYYKIDSDGVLRLQTGENWFSNCQDSPGYTSADSGVSAEQALLNLKPPAPATAVASDFAVQPEQVASTISVSDN